MEINAKQLIALAAIGGAVWYFMRKGSATSVTAATKPAVAPAAGSGGIWDGFGVGGDLAAAMGQVAATTGPLTTPAAVYDNKPLQVAPAAAPAPAPAPVNDGFVVGGGSSKSPSAPLKPPDMNNPFVQLAIGRYGQ